MVGRHAVLTFQEICSAIIAVVKGTVSRFGASLYYLFTCVRSLAQSQFFIVYEPIVSKSPNFACK